MAQLDWHSRAPATGSVDKTEQAQGESATTPQAIAFNTQHSASRPADKRHPKVGMLSSTQTHNDPHT